MKLSGIRLLVSSATILVVIAYLQFGIVDKDPTSLQSTDLPKDTAINLGTTETTQGAQTLANHKPIKSSHPQLNSATSPKPSTIKCYETPSFHVVARFEGERWVAHEDILLTDDDVSDSSVGDEILKIIALKRPLYWPGGRIPYTVDRGVGIDRVQAAFKEIEEKTTIRFVRQSDEADFVRVKAPADNQDLCQSFLGKKGGEQEIILGPACTHGQILHELMHTLGFVHEQSREDRDQYLNIYWENIQTAQKNQFQKIAAQISQPVPSEFDFKSILLYPVDAYSANGQFTITKKDGTIFFVNRAQLSEIDVQKVNSLYQ